VKIGQPKHLPRLAKRDIELLRQTGEPHSHERRENGLRHVRNRRQQSSASNARNPRFDRATSHPTPLTFFHLSLHQPAPRSSSSCIVSHINPQLYFQTPNNSFLLPNDYYRPNVLTPRLPLLSAPLPSSDQAHPTPTRAVSPRAMAATLTVSIVPSPSLPSNGLTHTNLAVPTPPRVSLTGHHRGSSSSSPLPPPPTTFH